MSKTDTRKDKTDSDQNKSTLGVLYTGYLDKKNPVTGSFKRRFVVLTQNALHWFKREDSDDLFGEERGQLTLGNILTNRILDEDSTVFEIQGIDGKKRYFRAATNVFCEEWVSAIRSAVKAGAQRARPANSRRASLNAVKHGDHDDDDDGAEGDKTEQVHVMMVTQSSALQQTEIVMAREPDWGRIVNLPSVKKGDQIIISLSNGGTVTLSYEVLVNKAEDANEFDVAVRDVPLASSLRLSVQVSGFDRNSGTSTPAGSMDDGPSASEKQRRLGKRISLSLREKIADFAQVAISDRSFAINTVLSIMVIMAGISSFMDVGPEAFLLYLFAGALSAYNIYQVFDETRIDHPQSMKNGLTLRLVIHGHTFTSPDNPVVEVDNEIPQRFIDGCDGDLKEARRRWDITRHWRESEGVNTILQEPQPYFYLICAMYPHYFCGKGKQGNVVYYERPGDFEGSQLYARGVTLDDLVRHWLFVTEYNWNVICNGDEKAKVITVLDIEKVKMSDLAGNSMEYLKKTVGYANQHYPERSYVIFIVNVPYFFSWAWKIVKPLVHPNTQKKVRILSSKEVLAGLSEYIDVDQIPEYYGGKLDFGGHDSCRFHCPESLEMNEYVRKINEKHSINVDSSMLPPPPSTGTGNGIPQPIAIPTSSSSNGNGDVMPPGNPGDMPNSQGGPVDIMPSGVGTTPTSRAMARRASLNSPPQAQRRGSRAGPAPVATPTSTSTESKSKL